MSIARDEIGAAAFNAKMGKAWHKLRLGRDFHSMKLVRFWIDSWIVLLYWPVQLFMACKVLVKALDRFSIIFVAFSIGRVYIILCERRCPYD